MTLENIDKRLSLYSEYLAYYLPKYRSPHDAYREYKETGIWFIGEIFMSFDNWLGANKHYDLIDYGTNIRTINGKLFRETKTDGFTFVTMIVPEFDY